MQVSANDAVFRDNGFFKAGSLSGTDAQKFWEDEILRGHEQKDREKTLRWLRKGVRIEDFLRGNLKGKFKGQQYDSQYPDEQSFENLVEYKHQTWVGKEISRLVTYGAVRTWESCGIEGFPKIIAPLQVEEEKTKNRLIYNAQYLNCFMCPPHIKWMEWERWQKLVGKGCTCSPLIIRTDTSTAKYMNHHGRIFHFIGRVSFTHLWCYALDGLRPRLYIPLLQRWWLDTYGMSP